MKHSYWALWGILAVAFVIFLSLSTCDEISIGPLRLKPSGLSSVFASEKEMPDSANVDSIEALTDAVPMHQALDKSPKTVLIIGDSMLEGLSPRLSAYCQASGHKLYSVIWYSSSTEQYGESHLLSDYIRVLNPDFIFISLGGNELFVTDVVAKREKYVKSIVEEIGDIPFLWIGPPNWKPDTGINDLIERSVPKGCFFLSDGLTFERKKDGAHPTAESASEWMDTVLHWMPEHARYYLQLSEPEVPSLRPTRYYIHSPGPLKQRPE